MYCVGREAADDNNKEDNMNVRITNQSSKRTGTRTEMSRASYTARRREDCRDNTDRNVYDLVIMMNDTITMGQTVGTPA